MAGRPEMKEGGYRDYGWVINEPGNGGVGRLIKDGVTKSEENPEEVKGKFKELLRRVPEKIMLDGGKYEIINAGGNKGKIIKGKQGFIRLEDTIILSFPRKGEPDDAKFLIPEVVVSNGGATSGEVNKVAEPTWKQILDLREKFGDPKYIIWIRTEVRRAVDGYGDGENRFERGIPFEEIELDVLKIASEKEPNKYIAEYLKKKGERINSNIIKRTIK